MLSGTLHPPMAHKRFTQFAWGLLIYNLMVILGGAYVRASLSGDGCGDHWPSCQGQILPIGGALKTIIEFSHRISTALLLPLILVLIVWAFVAFPRGHPVRLGAWLIFLGTWMEALIGAALVLNKWVALDRSTERAIVMPAHLVATFLLLMALALTAWWSGEGGRIKLKGQGAIGAALLLGLIGAILLGISGAITALGDTLFPSVSLLEGLKQDLAPGVHFTVGLRIYHPLIAISLGLYIVVVAGLAARLRPSPKVTRFARWTVMLFLLQMGVGLINLLALAPVWLQMIHLLMADLLWIAMTLLVAAALEEGVPQVELESVDWEAEHAAYPAPKTPAAHSAKASGDIPDAEPALPPATWKEYVALTKPRVISLLLLTTLMAMFVAAASESLPVPRLWVFLAVGVGFYMAAGAANCINMVLERDLDLRMGRTAKRPTVTHSIPPASALVFAFALMLGSFGILWAAANMLSAMLALAGLAFYVIIYTMLLKRRTWANIVIGGAAGAFPPLVGWAAVTNDLSLLAWTLFAIIFLWTPVHFWALALLIKEDYARAGVPMLPVVRGERATVIQMAFYTVLTVGVTALPLWMARQDGQASVGGVYIGAAVLLNLVLVIRMVQLFRHPERQQAKTLFTYSMLYLALLFIAMAVDTARWL